MGASAVTIKHTHMLQEKLEKKENEFQEYVIAQAGKTDALITEWKKKVISELCGAFPGNSRENCDFWLGY
jgi:hypothetical protein